MDRNSGREVIAAWIKPPALFIDGGGPFRDSLYSANSRTAFISSRGTSGSPSGEVAFLFTFF
jgi:hypothetical protein